MRVVLFGPPGSGKGTQAKLIFSLLGAPHISTGEIFRMNMDNNTSLGKKISEVMVSGNLVSDDLTNEIISDILSKLRGYILDGYPRSLAQAIWFDKYCKKNNTRVDHFLFFDISEEVAIKRIKNRTEYRPENDTLEKIQTRFDVYKETTLPCVNYYKDNKQLTVIEDGTVDEVNDRIKAILGVY